MGDLIDVSAIRSGPGAPLYPVYRSEVTRFGVGPFVPDGDTALLQPPCIAVAAEEPQQLIDDAFQMQLLGGDQRKAFIQVKTHLIAEDAFSACAGAIGLENAMFVHMAHEVFILAADRSGDGRCHRGDYPSKGTLEKGGGRSGGWGTT